MTSASTGALPARLPPLLHRWPPRPRPPRGTGRQPFSTIPGLHFFNYPLSPTLSIFSSLWDHSHLFINMPNYLPLTTKERKENTGKENESFPGPRISLGLLPPLGSPRRLPFIGSVLRGHLTGTIKSGHPFQTTDIGPVLCAENCLKHFHLHGVI